MKALLSIAAAALSLVPSAALALPYCPKVDQLKANLEIDKADIILSRSEPGDTGSAAHAAWATSYDTQMSTYKLQWELWASQVGCELILEYRPSKASFYGSFPVLR
jgi:hypothetical protein